MSEPGWYPDPAGSGGLRYWTGSAWSREVRPRLQPDRPPGQRPPAWLWWVVGALVLAVVVTLVVRQQWGNTIAADTNSSVPTVSQWDETSSPSISTPTPTSPPSSLDPSGAREAACEHLTGSMPDQPADRVASGGLSFPRPPGWRRYSDPRLPFSHDAAGVMAFHREEKIGWASSMAVAMVDVPDSYPGSAAMATRVAQCLVTSDFYSSVEVELGDVRTEMVTVSGVPATKLQARVRFDDPQLMSKATVMVVIVVDTPEPTMFIGLVKSEAAPQRADLAAAIQGLRVG